MAAVETSASLDTDRLASFLDIDPPDLQSVLSSAADGVVFLLQQVQVKAGEYDQLANAKELLEVNYGISQGIMLTGEQEVHTTNFKVTSLREQLQRALNETHELRTKSNMSGTLPQRY
jgi:hypothetical protein